MESGVCTLRHDNESGKGDHRHIGRREEPHTFASDRKAVSRRAPDAFGGHKQGARISLAAPELLFRVLSGKRRELVRAPTGAGPLFECFLQACGSPADETRIQNREPPEPDILYAHPHVGKILHAVKLFESDKQANCRIQPGIRASSAERIAAIRSLARCLTLSLLSWPQAAMMSRPRGVRTGEA